MLKNEHILAIPAHPDDEGSAWATLYKYHEHDAKISIAWMTNGERAMVPLGKHVNLLIPFITSLSDKKVRAELGKRISLIRKKEALKVAKIINASVQFLGFKDTKVPKGNNDEALLKITNLIRKLKPSIILTHWFNEMHQDHKNTAALVYNGYLRARDQDFLTEFPPHKARILGFWEERGRNYLPNFFIDISNQILRIKEWGKFYKSQPFRIVGRLARFKACRNSNNTPYDYVERFKVIGINKHKTFGEFFL